MLYLTFDPPASFPSTDDESPGLYGFLNVIVHSASGLKQSLSRRLKVVVFFLNRNHFVDYCKGCM